MTDERAEVARLLVALADDHPGFGILRRAARFVLEPAPEPARRPGTCRGCGVELPSPGPTGGRPRVWCAAPACQECRRQGRKPRQNAS